VGHQLGLFRVLDQARAGGVAVLAVVHDLPRAAAWAGRMVLLHEGRVTAEGPPHDVLTSAEAARAFRVSVRAHTLPGVADPLYSFEEPS
jgi:iron complex transport system ATP-binding protein